MIQLKFLRDYNGYLKDHIYNFSEDDENIKKIVDYGCAHTKEGLVYEGTGSLAIYYSKDRDELDGTIAPPMSIPIQLKEYRLLKVSDDKKPYELAWQKTNNTINDPVMKEWVTSHEKYGVLCGWNALQDKFLIVVDFDNQGIQDDVLESQSLPDTFAVKTARKGLLHLYYYSKEPINKWKILTKDKETLADVQGTSTQVIGPGSRIPDGRMYTVVNDVPIAEITAAELHSALDRFNPTAQEETLKVVEDGLTLTDFEKNFGRDVVVEEIKRKLKISDILESAGINTKHNPTKCPLHDSKGGKCLGFDDSKGIFNCFHCLKSNVKVWTINGYKNAENVIEGDIVLNALGERVKVRRVEKQNPKEKLLKIYTVASRIPLEVSEKHGMVVIKNTNCSVRTKKVSCNPNCSYLKYRKENRGKKCAKQKFEEYKLSEQIPADTITTNDSLVYPIPKYSKDVEFIDVHGTMKKKSIKLVLTNELLWILGLWVAEGSTERSKIQFSLHRKEVEYAERIIKYFKSINIYGSIHHNKGTDSKIVSVFNTPLQIEIEKLLGKGCANKKVPRFILDLPPNRLKYFVQGVFDGDGCKDKYYITQTSEELAYNLFEAGLKLGHTPTISKHEGGKKGVKKPRRNIYTVSYCEVGKGRHVGAFRYKDWYVMPINKIEVVPNEEDYLIDISVEGRHKTFLTAQGISHNCSEKGDAITLWQLVHSVTDFVEAKEKLCVELGIENKPYEPPAPTPPPTTSNRPSIQLPEDNRTLAEFAEEVSQYFKNSDEIFFKVDEYSIVEVGEQYDKQRKMVITSIRPVDPKRLVNIIESRVNTFSFVKVKKGRVAVFRTASEQTIKLLTANSTFLKSLYPVRRFLNFPAPFFKDGGLIIPDKVGFDDRYEAYFTHNTPLIKEINVEDAKNIITDLFTEFCFKETIDRDMAIAYLITPMCRGLYSEFNVRTPLFIIQANRERAGKDYLAGVVGIVYEGQAVDDTPFVTSDKSESNADEWRKKFTSALKAGRRRIHSSNNRGFLANAVLEQFLTSTIWSDRQLGSNTNLELSNEIDVSMSANIGLTYTSDLWYRARPINLFYAEENPNERTYKRPNLHKYVSENRTIILSAIYTLILSWVRAGMPQGKPFTSFAEWAFIVGGIMEHHGFLSPCIQIEDNSVGGDKETRSMKEFYTFMSDYQTNHPDEYKNGFTINDMRRIITHGVGDEEFEGFAGWDFTDKSSQIKFGLLIKRFLNRTFHCNGERFTGKSTLVIRQNNNRSIRITYGFDLEGQSKENNTSNKVEEEIVMDGEGEFDKLVRLLSNVDDCTTNFLLLQGVTEKTIKKACTMGVCFEPRPGRMKLL